MGRPIWRNSSRWKGSFAAVKEVNDEKTRNRPALRPPRRPPRMGLFPRPLRPFRTPHRLDAPYLRRRSRCSRGASRPPVSCRRLRRHLGHPTWLRGLARPALADAKARPRSLVPEFLILCPILTADGLQIITLSRRTI